MDNAYFKVVGRGEWVGDWVSLYWDKIEPIDVVSRPGQCCYEILGKMDNFTVKGGVESCITELAKG